MAPSAFRGDAAVFGQAGPADAEVPAPMELEPTGGVDRGISIEKSSPVVETPASPQHDTTCDAASPTPHQFNFYENDVVPGFWPCMTSPGWLHMFTCVLLLNVRWILPTMFGSSDSVAVKVVFFLIYFVMLHLALGPTIC